MITTAQLIAQLGQLTTTKLSSLTITQQLDLLRSTIEAEKLVQSQIANAADDAADIDWMTLQERQVAVNEGFLKLEQDRAAP